MLSITSLPLRGTKNKTRQNGDRPHAVQPRMRQDQTGRAHEVRPSIREETNCQGYASVDDWCQLGLFCQPVRRQECLMFSLLVALFVYISLSALRTHLNCQSTSKACRSFIFPWHGEWFSLNWVLVIVMTWEQADRQLFWFRKKGSLFVTPWKHQCPCNGLQLSMEASTWQLCGRTNLQPQWLASPTLDLVMVSQTNRPPSAVRCHGALRREGERWLS